MAAKRKPAAGGPDVGPTPGQPQTAVCVIDGCERPVLHRGLCAEHWKSPRGDDN